MPVAGISIGIATTKVRSFAHYGEAVSVATEMKQYAKREPKSSYAVDRQSRLTHRPSGFARRVPRDLPARATYTRVSRRACLRGGVSPPAVRVRDPPNAIRGLTR